MDPIIETCYAQWLTDLNPIEILLGFILGIISSILYAWTTSKIQSRRITRRHHPIAGTYVRYWLEDKVKGQNKILATAELIQDNRNKFTMIVRTLLEYGDGNPSAGQPYIEDNIQEWTGEVTMDSLKNGTIVWEMRKPANGNNGFKRIIIEKDFGGIAVVGEKDHGFNVERFTEKLKQT